MFKVEKFETNTDADNVCKELFSKIIPGKKRNIKTAKIKKKKSKPTRIKNDKLKDEIRNVLNDDNLVKSSTNFKQKMKMQKSQEPLLKRLNPKQTTLNDKEESDIDPKRKRKRKRKVQNIEQKNVTDSVEPKTFLNKKLKKGKSKQNLNDTKSLIKDDFVTRTISKEDTQPTKVVNAKSKENSNKNSNVRVVPTTKKQKGRDLPLRERMMARLQASRFRYINEQLYSTDSREAQKFFTEDPDAFKGYHEGYKQQVNKWPLNPVDVMIKSLQKLPKTYIIADFGCGTAKIAETLSHKVHSFDLVASNDLVVACDMAHVPLKNASIDVAVFCLSLMGTNLQDYLLEANRVLKQGGLLKIAEVESRFSDIDEFIEALKRFNFKNVWKDLSHNLFYFLDFKKTQNIGNKKKLPTIGLQPCLYKKR